MTTGLGRTILAVLCLAAVLLAGWAGVRGGAQAMAYAPRQLMERWHQGKEGPDPERWASAYRQLGRASDWVPGNADLLADMGHMASLRAGWEPLWSEASSRYQREAIDHFRRALRARPSWGLTWAYLARELARNGRLSAGGLDALDKAMLLAPLEQPAQREVISLGAAIWPVLGEEQRRQLQRIMKFALDGLASHVVGTAVDYGLADEIRPLLETEQQHDLLERSLRARGRGG